MVTRTASPLQVAAIAFICVGSVSAFERTDWWYKTCPGGDYAATPDKCEWFRQRILPACMSAMVMNMPQLIGGEKCRSDGPVQRHAWLHGAGTCHRLPEELLRIHS